MSEENEPRLGNNAKNEIKELTRTVKALLEAIKEAEEVTGEALMKSGTYLGVEFGD